MPAKTKSTSQSPANSPILRKDKSSPKTPQPNIANDVESPAFVSPALLRSDLNVNLNNPIENLANRKEYLEHNTLIEIMHGLGYNINKQGVCHGFSTVARHAILVGQFEKFKKRAQFINQNSPATIVKGLTTIKRKRKKRKPLDIDDYQYLDLMPFFDSINVSQSPEKINQIFLNVIDQVQGSKASRKLVESEELERRKGESILHEFPCILNRTEITDLLSTYAKICDDLNLKDPISLHFDCVNHAINVTYLPKTKEWIFIDANAFKEQNKNSNLPANQSKKTVAEIANTIHEAYTDIVPERDKKNNYLAMTVKAFATNDNKNAKPFKQQFTASHFSKKIVSANHAMRSDIKNNTYLHMAALLHDFPLQTINFKDHQKHINTRNLDGNTPLTYACEVHNYAMVEKLLKAGANPNSVNTFGVSPLVNAKLNNDTKMVKLLSDYKAKEIIDKEKYMHQACKRGNEHLFNLLEQYNIDINDPIEWIIEGETCTLRPIEYALYNNNFALVTSLTKYGADLELGLDWAIKNKNDIVFRFLVDLCYLNPTNEIKNKVITAVKQNDMATVSFLSQYIDTNREYTLSDSPFAVAYSNDDEGLALELIEQNLFTYKDFLKVLDVQDSLYIEAMLNHAPQIFSSLKYLQNLTPEEIEKLPKRFSIQDLAALPVIIAASLTPTKLLKRLLELGFPANTTHLHMGSALHSAVHHNNYEAIKILLSYGADQNVRYKERTPYQLSQELNASESANVLAADQDKQKRRVQLTTKKREHTFFFDSDNDSSTKSPAKTKDKGLHENLINNPWISDRGKKRKIAQAHTHDSTEETNIDTKKSTMRKQRRNS